MFFSVFLLRINRSNLSLFSSVFPFFFFYILINATVILRRALCPGTFRAGLKIRFLFDVFSLSLSLSLS
jgi:hypothetical protein